MAIPGGTLQILTFQLDIHLLGDLSIFWIYALFWKITIMCKWGAEKNIFVPQSDNLRMPAELSEILVFTMQKLSLDILMIIWDKSYQMIYFF